MNTTLHRSAATPRTAGTTLGQRLTSRRGAWVALLIGLALALGLVGGLQGATGSARNDAAPLTSESMRAAAVAETFPGHDVSAVLLVATRDDGAALAQSDLTALAGLAKQLPTQGAGPASPPVESADHRAALIQLPVRDGADNTANARLITDLRGSVSAHTPAGIDIQVTGGIAFGADIAKAFDGANITLLLVTIGIVALLLLLTYRSPVLWLIPLAVVALADQVAAVVTAGLGGRFDLQFDAGVVSVLVFGAGTNYALLLISRYREQLRETADHRTALAAAWRATVPAVVASNVTVVLALVALVLASVPGTRGLGVAGAVGLLIAAVAVLGLLPAALALVGRRVFWPFVPKPGTGLSSGSGLSSASGGPWGWIARRVSRRPLAVLVAGTALLGVLATGLVGTNVGLDQTQRFRVPSESAAGLETLAAHFPGGEAQPIMVFAKADHAAQVLASAQRVPGVERAVPAGDNGAAGSAAMARIIVTGDATPGSEPALTLVRDLRTAVHAVPGADALVGGQPAVDVDARAGNEHDLLLVGPIILAIAAVVLLVLLRSIVAPLVLILVNTASSLAAIGAGAWLGRQVFDAQALDLQVPLFAFLFLVALGIDYTIFLVHRARHEAAEHGTREGMVRAVASTGGVITSAGLVLAGVFAALAVLPLVTLGQLGFIVGLGVLVDTLVVRTVIVPALFALIGDRIWWPSRPAGTEAPVAAPEAVPETVPAAGAVQ